MTENNNLTEVHSLLLELQEVLKGKFALEAEIEALPVNLVALQGELADANKKYLELSAKYKQAKDEVASNSIKYDEAFQYRTESEKMMDKINTQREYESLLKQIDEAKVREAGLLKARTMSQVAVEDLNEQLDAQEVVCNDLKARADAESAKIDETMASKKAEMAEYEARCLEIKDRGISDELYAKFSNIVKNKKGVGIVPIHGLVCQGCNMILPQQFVNDVRMDNSIVYCPYCSRILFYEECEDAPDYSHLQSQAENEDGSLADEADEGGFDGIL